MKLESLTRASAKTGGASAKDSPKTDKRKLSPASVSWYKTWKNVSGSLSCSLKWKKNKVWILETSRMCAEDADILNSRNIPKMCFIQLIKKAHFWIFSRAWIIRFYYCTVYIISQTFPNFKENKKSNLPPVRPNYMQRF